jgi:hypothetical protein
MDERLNTFIATDGTVLKLRAVREVSIARRQQQVEAKMRLEGAPLDPPTRTIVALGGHGDAEKVPMTAETLNVLDNPEQTARNKALWAAHETALVKLADLQREERVKILLALGVEIEGGIPPLDQWRDQLDYLGVAVPEHPLDQKAYYLMFVVLNDYDLNVLLSQIQMLGMGKAVTGEQVASFQESVQSEVGEAVNSLVRQAKERVERVRMASTPTVSGDEGSKNMGVAA